MATIYRFVVETKESKGGGGRKNNHTQNNNASKKSAGKKGRWVSIIGGEKGGVEHNRKMRAINPLLNKITHGAYEKSMRVGRAGLGLIQRNTETGAIGLSGVAITIIISFIIQQLLAWQRREKEIAETLNNYNYSAMENGTGAIRGAYEISTNMFSGRINYNENK